MSSFPFDTHRVVKDLEEAGFTEAQAEAVIAALGTAVSSNLATKADMDGLKAELKADNIALRDELKTDNATLRSDMQSENATLRSDIQSLELRMTIRLGAIAVAVATVAVAVAKFL